MKCIMNKETKKVFRVPDKVAYKFVHEQPNVYKFVSKSAWKESGRNYSERGEK